MFLIACVHGMKDIGGVAIGRERERLCLNTLSGKNSNQVQLFCMELISVVHVNDRKFNQTMSIAITVQTIHLMTKRTPDDHHVTVGLEVGGKKSMCCLVIPGNVHEATPASHLSLGHLNVPRLQQTMVVSLKLTAHAHSVVTLRNKGQRKAQPSIIGIHNKV